MKCVLAKFIPEQKEHRAAVANDLIQSTNNEPDFLKKVITRDEWWVYSCDPEMKAQWFQWTLPGSPHTKKVRQSHSKIKTMLTVFFYREGVVYCEDAPQGQPVNKEYYLNVLRHLRDDVGRKQLQLRATGDGQLHRDNTPTQAAHLL